ASGEHDQARTLLQDQLPMLRRLDTPFDANLTRVLCATLEQLGEIDLRAGHVPEAEAWFLEQESRLRALKDAAPDDPLTRRALAVACEKVGGVLQRSGRLKEAAAKLEEEIDLLRALSGQDLDDL